MPRTRRVACALALICSALASAADGDRTVVQLRLNRNVAAFSGMMVDFGQTRGESVIAAPGSFRVGKAPGVTVRAEPVADKPGSYHLRIQSPEGDPVSIVLTPSQAGRVEIPRRGGPLPYLVTLDSNAGPNRSPHEAIFWMPDYRAEGMFEIGSCHALFAIWDVTADGVFNRRDFNQGSAAGIDIDGNGKIFGRHEYVTGGEVFQFCGKSFYVDPNSLEPDGSAVTIVETLMSTIKTGAPLPSLTLETTDGETIHSSDWKGKVALLDFWASWCGYCIAGFPMLEDIHKTYGHDLQILSINTDEPDVINAARRVLSEHNLSWPVVISGKGLSDPLWMMFQSMEQQSLPLYVLIGRDGTVSYGGSGGENLSELRAALPKLISSPKQ